MLDLSPNISVIILYIYINSLLIELHRMDIFLSNPIISDLQETYLKFKDIVWFKQKVMRKKCIFFYEIINPKESTKWSIYIRSKANQTLEQRKLPRILGEIYDKKVNSPGKCNNPNAYILNTVSKYTERSLTELKQTNPHSQLETSTLFSLE